MKSIFKLFCLVCCLTVSSFIQAQTNRGFFKVYRMEGKDIPSGYVEVDDGWIIAGNTTTRFLGISDVPDLGFLMKIDLQGKIVWKQFISDTTNWDVFINDYSAKSYNDENCIKKLRNGDLLITGVTFARGSYGVMALRFDPKNLVVKWRYRDNFPDNFTTLATDEDSTNGDIYIFSERWYFNRHGYPCMHKLDARGQLIWKKHYSQLQIGNQGSRSSFMFLIKGFPFFLVNYSDSYIDSCFLVRVKPLSGDILDKTVIAQNYVPEYMYRCGKGFNIEFIGADDSSKNLQLYLNSGLNIIERRYLDKNYIHINSFYGDGYTKFYPNDSTTTMSDPNGKVVVKFKFPIKDISNIEQEFVYMVDFQSTHGGICTLGYKNINAQLGQFHTYQFCVDDLNCTDIFFMRSDDSGRYLLWPKQPDIDQVLIYPNPCSDKLAIRFDLNTDDHLSFELWDVLGRSVLKTDAIAFQSGYNEQFLNLSGLSKGVYHLTIISGNGLRFTETVLID